MPTWQAVEDYYGAVLRKVVGAQCHLVGWQLVSSTALDVLVDLLRHQLLAAARRTAAHGQLAGRTCALLEDAGPVLGAAGLARLARYLASVESPPFADHIPPALPVPKQSSFNFLRPGSQEIVTRPIHVHEHLPPMLQTEPEEMSAESGALVAVGSGPSASGGAEMTSHLDSSARRSRQAAVATDFDIRPLRDLSCVMMTTSGFISTSVEGKLPDSRLPEDSDDQSDGHGKLKTRKQRADTYRRLSEREHERKARERELWSHSDDLFDIIDVKVDEDCNTTVSSPEKSAKLHESSAKSVGETRKRSSVHSSSKIRRDSRMKKKERAFQKSDGKNKLSIFRKKSKVQPEKPQRPLKKVAVVAKAEPISVVEEDAQSHAEVSVSSPTPSTHVDDAACSSKVVVVKEEKMEQESEPAAESRKLSGPEAVKCEAEADASSAAQLDRSSLNEVSSPQAVSDHEMLAAPEPDPSELLNNPLIPRFSFPFASASQGSSIATVPAFPPIFVDSSNADESKPGSPVAETHGALSPSLVSNVSGRSGSLSPPPKRTPGSSLTPLERLEMADRAEKKRDKEHKKNKKDKKEKRKKDKKDRDRKDKDDKHEKKKKRSEKLAKEDDLVPKLTVRIGAQECSTEPLSPEPRAPSPPRLFIKPIREDPPKPSKKVKTSVADVDARVSISAVDHAVDAKSSKVSKELRVSKGEKGKSSSGRKKKGASGVGVADIVETNVSESVAVMAAPATASAPAAVITETVGSYIDSEGNQVWICPTCGRQDDGSPMIGCDRCDDWYHWVCVGIAVPPDQDEDWFCPRCSLKQLDSGGGGSGGATGKRGRGRSRKKH